MSEISFTGDGGMDAKIDKTSTNAPSASGSNGPIDFPGNGKADTGTTFETNTPSGKAGGESVIDSPVD